MEMVLIIKGQEENIRYLEQLIRSKADIWCEDEVLDRYEITIRKSVGEK